MWCAPSPPLSLLSLPCPKIKRMFFRFYEPSARPQQVHFRIDFEFDDVAVVPLLLMMEVTFVWALATNRQWPEPQHTAHTFHQLTEQKPKFYWCRLWLHCNIKPNFAKQSVNFVRHCTNCRILTHDDICTHTHAHTHSVENAFIVQLFH